jgi:hypothetical protein
MVTESAQNTVRSQGPAGSPASAAGVKPSQNQRLGLQRPRPQGLELGHTSCHRLLRSITDTRTVTDDTNTNIDQAQGVTDQRADHPNRRGRLLADPGRTADQIGGNARLVQVDG